MVGQRNCNLSLVESGVPGVNIAEALLICEKGVSRFVARGKKDLGNNPQMLDYVDQGQKVQSKSSFKHMSCALSAPHQRSPYRDAENAFGNWLRRRWSRNNAGELLAGADASVAFTLNDPTVGIDGNFDNLRVFRIWVVL